MIDETEDRLGMTEEEWARFQKHTRGYGDQDENGVDITLLTSNLRLTPTERIRKSFRLKRAIGILRNARVIERP